MRDVAQVSVVVDPAVRYPGAGAAADTGSGVAGMVDEVLRQATGGAGGPLLRTWVPEGARVFVLPNLVLHRRTDRGEPLSRFLAKCTNGSVVAPLVAHAVEAAGESRLVSVGSAPLQSCDYGRAAREAGFTGDQPDGSDEGFAPLEPMDLRSVATVWSKFGALLDREERDVPTVRVDLGPRSLLDELYQGADRVDFRVGDYDPDVTRSFHAPGRHVYTIHRDVLDSDVLISMPKLKTHEKVGITCALKGTIGTVTHKECLAHYRHAGPGGPGDELPHGNPLRSLAAEIADRSYAAPQNAVGNVTRVIGKSAFRLARMGHHGIMGGAWSGNDTAWRMALDVARILRFARPDGSIAPQPQRSHLVLVDGIVAGEGEGPLSPSPVPAGTLVFSDDPVAADLACARLMGYEPEHLALLTHALDPSMDLPLRTWSTSRVRWGEHAVPAVEALPSVLGRPFRPPKGWLGAIERSTQGVGHG